MNTRIRRKIRGVVQRLTPREHKRLTKSGYSFAVAESVAQLNPLLWNQAVDGGSVFLSRRYLDVLESHRPPNVETRYALITDGHEPIAALACQVVTLDAERVGKKRPDALPRGLRPVLRRLKGVLRERVLVCGNLLTWGPHGVAFSEAGRLDPSRAWAGVAEALYRIRRAERISGGSDLSLIKDFASDSMPDLLSGAGFRRVATEPNMALTIDDAWSSYDDYLAALDGKYRKSVRQIHKEIETGGAVVERLADLAPVAGDLHRLFLSVQESNTLRPVTAPPTYLATLVRAFGSDARASVIRKDDRILGFVATLRDRDTAVGYHIGFDREAAANLPLYLRLLHEVVGHAIELKCKSLSLGRTALEPKARLGARPEPMEVWVKHRTGGLNLAIGTLLGVIEPAAAPERNPFKKPRS